MAEQRWRPVVLLLLLVSAPLFSSPPGDARVKTELEQLIREVQGESGDLDQRVGRFFQNLLAFVSRLGIVFIIGMVLGILLLLFFLVRRLLLPLKRDRRLPRAGGKVPEASEETCTGPGALYELALAAAGEGDFGRAAIILHRASIQRLLHDRLLEQGREYTNTDIRLVLQSRDELYSQFCKLAGCAERVLFREDVLTGGEFRQLAEEYRQVFGGGRR